jgi:hypothetical protein
MKKLVVIWWLFFGVLVSCATSPRALAEFETKYVKFEASSVAFLNRASDKDLLSLYEQYRKELTTLERELKQKKEIAKYENRWNKATTPALNRIEVIRVKNSGNYLVSGNSIWQRFQTYYVVSNMVNTMINALTEYRSKNPYDFGAKKQSEIINPIFDEMTNGLSEYQPVTAEQKEWVSKQMEIRMILAFGTNLSINSYPYSFLIDFHNNLPPLVDLSKTRK